MSENAERNPQNPPETKSEQPIVPISRRTFLRKGIRLAAGLGAAAIASQIPHVGPTSFSE